MERSWIVLGVVLVIVSISATVAIIALRRRSGGGGGRAVLGNLEPDVKDKVLEENVTLDFTPGNKLIATGRKMDGVTQVKGDVIIIGSNIRAADVNRVLGGLEVVEGKLSMERNTATFATEDSAALKFAALRTVRSVLIRTNNSKTAASVISVDFPALTHVTSIMELQSNARLVAVLCPRLQTVAGVLALNNNPVLDRIDFSSLVEVKGHFQLQHNKRLTTTGISVSLKFASFSSDHSMLFVANGSDFGCTTENGLKAVLTACHNNAQCTPLATNPATCK